MDKSKNQSNHSIESESLVIHVFKELYTLLSTGELVSGQSVTYRGLAERLHVSLGTMNFALNALRDSGIIETRPRRLGSTVSDIQLEDLWCSLQYRLAIETRAAILAVHNATDVEMRELRFLAYELDTRKPEDFSDSFTSEYEFHKKILEMSHVPSLARQNIPLLDSFVKGRLCRYLPMLDREKDERGQRVLIVNNGHLCLASLISGQASQAELTLGLETHILLRICQFYPCASYMLDKLLDFREKYRRRVDEFRESVRVEMETFAAEAISQE